MDKFVFLLFLLRPAASDSDDVEKRQTGDNVTLSCQAGSVTITALEWTKTDQKTAESIFFYRDGHSETPYGDRVQLLNREPKNGDASIILRNVGKDDSGKYDCRVAVGGSRRQKRAFIEGDPIKSIKLVVTDSASKNEHTNPNDGTQTNGNPNDGIHSHVGLAAVLVPNKELFEH